MRHIIDDSIQKNIEMYYAFIQFVSMITLQKVSVVETRKDELKNQIKNEGQKKPLLLIKKGEQVIFLFTFYQIIYKFSHGFLTVGILFHQLVLPVYQMAFAQ